MIGIYKITSPRGKVYVGQSRNIERRRKRYHALRDCKGQPKLYNSIVKYGFSEHVFEVLEECLVEELNRRERYWQDFYNVLEGGLNCVLVPADGLTKVLSAETLSNMSKAKLGKKMPPVSEEWLRKRRLRRGPRGPYGPQGPHSEEHRRNIGKALQGVPKAKVTCPHCNKEGSVSNMSRWHFDNCKKKPQ